MHTSSRRRLAFVVAGLVCLIAIAAVAIIAWTGPAWTPFARAAADPAAANVWVCPMHPDVRSHEPGTCPICGMELVEEAPPAAPAVEPGHQQGAESAGAAAPTAAPAPFEPRAGITLDLRRRQLIGVRTAEVARRPLSRTTRAVGVIQYDETRRADVNLKIEAYIRDLHVDYTGQYIRRGQPLFTIYSPDLLATQHEYLLALKSRDQLMSSQVADARAYADRLAASARQRLLLWDLPESEITRLEQTREPSDAVEFRSPVGGYVIEKRVVAGQRVMPGESLYTVADLSVVWVEADVYEQDLAFVARGHRASVTVDAWPGERFAGRVTYVYPFVEARTRTVKVRLELPNPRGRLKPGMFANVELSSALGPGLVVPRDAVIDTGRAQFVFVALGDGYFEPRRVRTGQRVEEDVQIVEGLEEGDVVASAATFFIDSESQLRAAIQGFEALPAPAGEGGGPEVAAAGLVISLRTEPDPPRHGDNTVVVEVRDREGAAIEDAEVSVRLYMPPMPSMNMPAMRTEAPLLPRGGGVYGGHVTVSMAGRWETTVLVVRNGQRLGSREFALVAR